MMIFRDLACAHLSQYKSVFLEVIEDGIYNYRGKNIPKTHILPLLNRDKNIIEPYREHFFLSDYAKIKLHKYFHHLNSSQALCINLFYPLIVENALDLFMNFMNIAPELSIHSLFEKDSELENAARRTSFDFYVQLANQSQVFVEVKYTENGFGKAKNDIDHRNKFRNTYLPLLVKKSSLLVEECQNEQLFLKHYQILRNLVHISDTDQVVLLFPSANTKVTKEASYAKDHFLTDAGRDRLKIVFLNELISFLETQNAGLPLDGYYQKFRTKYLPTEKGS